MFRRSMCEHLHEQYGKKYHRTLNSIVNSPVHQLMLTSLIIMKIFVNNVFSQVFTVC